MIYDIQSVLYILTNHLNDHLNDHININIYKPNSFKRKSFK